eukprot:jgi/Botrbrau1/2363/Bobra.39_1s0047.1
MGRADQKMEKELVELFQGLSIKDGDEDAFEIVVRKKCEELHAACSGSKVPLNVLENFLQKLKELLGLSNKQIRIALKSLGVCLSNCEVLGGPKSLAAFLRQHRGMFIRKERAKKYKLVSFCLVRCL